MRGRDVGFLRVRISLMASGSDGNDSASKRKETPKNLGRESGRAPVSPRREWQETRAAEGRWDGEEDLLPETRCVALGPAAATEIMEYGENACSAIIDSSWNAFRNDNKTFLERRYNKHFNNFKFQWRI